MLAKMDCGGHLPVWEWVFVGSVSSQVFVDVLGQDRHGRVHWEPPIVASSHYYNSQHKELGRRTEEAEE